jgi:hypothetical protein
MSARTPANSSGQQPDRANGTLMQWAVLAILTLLTVLLLLLSVIAFFLTRNWFTLTPVVGDIPLGFAWTWIIKRVFPLNERDHQRELERVKRLPTDRPSSFSINEVLHSLPTTPSTFKKRRD